MAEDCSSIQLINGDGELNVADLDNFVRSATLPECGLSYAVVAILGPQSSGKSTLLNNLFDTNFVMMNPRNGRTQTTKGVWMAKAVNIVKPLTVIMDFEGNDGQERGLDVTFEKQSALFALVLADVVLINMWHNDMGRENGANKPLLRTVFQAILKLFSPRKTTLLFVIRDTNTETPPEILDSDLKIIIKKIWEEVPKPEARKNAALEEFFVVKVVALPHFTLQKVEFINEVAKLKEQFHDSIATGGIAGDSQNRAPGLAFSMTAQNFWNDIKANKDLDLPALKVLVATYNCDKIANETYGHFLADGSWKAIKDAATSGPVYGCGNKLSSILETYLAKYENETMFFDEGVRQDKRQELKSKMLEHMHPIYDTLLGHLRSRAKERFENQLDKALSRGEGFATSVHNCKESCLVMFDQRCNDVVVQQAPDWNAKNVREELEGDIKAHSLSVGDKKLSEIVACYEEKLTDTLGVVTESELKAAKSDSWPSIRAQFKRNTDSAESEFLVAVSGFDFDKSTIESKLQTLRKYARSVVEKKAKGVGKIALFLMKDRFSHAFNHEEDSMPRRWNGDEDIKKIAKDARTKSLKILPILAIIRLDEKPDNVEEHITFSCRMHSSSGEEIDESGNLLNSSVWQEVSPADTIITPMECKSYWKQFLAATTDVITQVISAQEAIRAKYKAEAEAAITLAKAETVAARHDAEFRMILAKAIVGLVIGFIGGVANSTMM